MVFNSIHISQCNQRWEDDDINVDELFDDIGNDPLLNDCLRDGYSTGSKNPGGGHVSSLFGDWRCAGPVAALGQEKLSHTN